MVRFPPASDREDGDLAPVTYLRRAPAPAPADAAQDAAGGDGGRARSAEDRRREEGLARITAHVAAREEDPTAAGGNTHGGKASWYGDEPASEGPTSHDPGGNEPDGDDPDGDAREAPVQDIETVSMRALTRRGMSRWELGDLLARREYDIEAIEAELDRLQRVDLLDDAALAETVVRTKHERKGLGRNALVRELSQRHIDPAVIDQAVSAIGDEDEQAMATELAVKRARQFTSLDAATAERRLTGYLMRRGYSSSIVREATRVALAGHGRGSGVRFR
jgi:regulatory protein